MVRVIRVRLVLQHRESRSDSNPTLHIQVIITACAIWMNHVSLAFELIQIPFQDHGY
jgi:hypothetical protein